MGDFLLQQLLLQFVWGGRGKVMVDVCDPRLIFDGIKVTVASNHYISKTQIFLVVSCLPPALCCIMPMNINVTYTLSVSHHKHGEYDKASDKKCS